MCIRDRFAPGERTVLYAPVQWQSRIRTLLEMMARASTEQDYPGPLYLLLILHYVAQECICLLYTYKMTANAF